MLSQFWDKVRVPFMAITAVCVCMTTLYGFFNSIRQWNENTEAIKTLTMKVDRMVIAVDSIGRKEIKIAIPEIKVINDNTKIILRKTDQIFELVTKHLSKTITTDNAIFFGMEF